MFGFITRHFQTQVKEDPITRIVTVSNTDVDWLFKDIAKVWGTSTLTTHMFDKITKNSFQFYSFFVPDVYYTIDKIFEYKSRYSKDTELKRILDGLRTNTWYADYFKPRAHTLDFEKLKEIKYTLMPAQMTALTAYDEKVVASHLKGYLLAADVGTGKSVLGCALAACLDANPIFIVCPKYIIDSVWVDAINVQFHGKKKIWASNTNRPLDNSYDVYIFHYEALEKAVYLFTKHRFSNPVIILDESHNLNDIKSMRTQLYLEMCKASHSKNIIHESGTAVKAMGTETIPLFRAIDDMFTLEVETKFKAIYKKSATRALEILANRLGMVSHRISKDTVMGDAKPIRKEIKIRLPDATRYTLPFLRNELQAFIIERTKFYQKDMDKHEKVYKDAIEIYKKSMKFDDQKLRFDKYQENIRIIRTGWDNTWMGPLSEYCNKFEKDEIMPVLNSEHKKQFKDSKSVYKYLELKIMGEFLGGVLGRRRVELHSALIEHSGIDKLVMEAEKKTICFTNYVDTMQVANKYFEARGFQPLLVYSETNSNVAGILKEFINSDTANPLIATIQSLSTGVTLICANTCIFLNLPFRDSDYEQASNRIFRIGQTAQVYLYDLILDTGAEANLSTRMSDILAWSKNQVDVMLSRNSNLAASVESTVSVESIFDFVLDNEKLLNEINEQMPYPGLEAYYDPKQIMIQDIEPEHKPKKALSVFDW